MNMEVGSSKVGLWTVVLAVVMLVACARHDPDALVASAKEYLAKNDRKAAVIQLKNALQADPRQAEARFLLGKTLLELGDPSAAESELKKASDLNYPVAQVAPPLLRARLRLGMLDAVIKDAGGLKVEPGEAAADVQTTVGQAYLAQGKTDAAQSAFAAALSARPGYVPARLAQARMQAARRDLDGALAVVNAVLGESGGDVDAWKLKGDIERAQGKAEAAVADYREALKVKPDFVPAHGAAVLTLLQSGRHDEAVQQLGAMRQAAPKHPQTLFLQALEAYQSGKLAEAQQAIQQELKMVPDSLAGMQLAAAIEFRQNDLRQAESHLLKILQRAPDARVPRRLLLSTYVRGGQTVKAMQELDKLGSSVNGDAELLSLAGQVQLQAGDVKKAQEYFAKAVQMDPRNARTATALAISHLAGGETETGFSELDRITASQDASAADLALISAHMQLGEHDKALAAIAVLESKLPKNPLPFNLRGGVLAAKHDIAGARAAFTAALAIKPDYYPAAANLANLDVLEKKPEDARKRYEAVIAADPHNVQARLALASLRADNGGSVEEVSGLIGKAVEASPAEPQARVAMISYLLRVKQEKRAVSAAQEAMAAIPNRPEILDAAGQAMRAAGDTNQALVIYKKLADETPDSPMPYLRIAEIQAAQKNSDAALQALDKALTIKPDLLEAQRGKIQLYMAADRSGEAVAVARRIQAKQPKQAIGFLLEGDIHASRKSWNDAATAFRGGVKQTDAPQLAVRLHGALSAGGKESEARSFADAWIKAHPKDMAMRSYLAETASARHDFNTASGLYKAALAANPDNALVLNNLAWVSAQQNDARAIEYAEKANRLAPGKPEIMDTLGMLKVAKGDAAGGIELLKKAFELAPAQAAIRLNLAKALIKGNQPAEARKHLEGLAALGDKFAEQAEVAQLLKGL
jgi:putative PEP-CTERM system TPR-repeat lipoprotein